MFCSVMPCVSLRHQPGFLLKTAASFGGLVVLAFPSLLAFAAVLGFFALEVVLGVS
jgi:hypothetical protein